jgi:WD40 repeat protein
MGAVVEGAAIPFASFVFPLEWLILPPLRSQSVLADVTLEPHGRGLLPPDVFRQTLALNGLELPRKALERLTMHFQQPNGAVQTHHFLQWVDLSKPTDHVDPELTLARLPQPYRRIAKVLDRDILDAAWEIIETSSARYKAETAAALSARSARAGALVPTLDDDYAAAKKRCCKTFAEVTPRTQEAVGLVRVHCRRPFAVVGRTSNATETGGGTLDFVHTQRGVTSASISIVLPAAAPATEGISGLNQLQLVGASELQSRLASSAEGEERLVVAVLVQEEVYEGDVTSKLSHVLLYELSVSSPMVRLIASVEFSDPSVTVQSMTLSSDASLLAIATNDCATILYSIPATDADPPSSPLTPFTTLTSDTAAAAVYFLHAPVVDMPLSSLTLSRPYALAVVAGKCLAKYRLSCLDTSTTPTVTATWPHLSPITCSSVDATSQFITVGLADGMVVVWDLLSDRDHVMLPPPPSPPAPSSSGSVSVDAVVLIGHQFLVALSVASQQLLFYDLAHRTKPTLLRVVTPPPSTSKEAESTRLLSLSTSSSLLDVPFVMVAYSTGCVLLYDARSGEAIASLRVPKPSPTPRTVVFPSTHSVVVLTPSLVVFNWRDLLSTALPTLLAVLQDKRVEPTTENLKRGFLAMDVKRPFPEDRPLSVGGRLSLQSMLLASAGRSAHTTKPTELELLLSGSRSSSSLSASDSHTSLASTATYIVAPPDALPALPNTLSCPYKPNLTALFERFCHEESGLASGDAKLHRRRNDLLKILTAAW